MRFDFKRLICVKLNILQEMSYSAGMQYCVGNADLHSLHNTKHDMKSIY